MAVLREAMAQVNELEALLRKVGELIAARRLVLKFFNAVSTP